MLPLIHPAENGLLLATEQRYPTYLTLTYLTNVTSSFLSPNSLFTLNFMLQVIRILPKNMAVTLLKEQ